MAVVDFDYGSDANDGSFDNPFATLRHALSVAESDETITIVLREGDSKFTVQTGGIVEEARQGQLSGDCIKDEEGKVGTKTFYGIWENKECRWSCFIGHYPSGVYCTEYLPVVMAAFHNAKRKGERNNWPDFFYQVRLLGDDGLPTGEPLND